MKPLLAKITLLVLLISSCDTPELESTDYLNTSEEKLINSQSYYSFSKQILNALAKGVFDRPAP